jgi:hypothetical protein
LARELEREAVTYKNEALSLRDSHDLLYRDYQKLEAEVERLKEELQLVRLAPAPEEPVIKESLTTEPALDWRELLPDEVIQNGDNLFYEPNGTCWEECDEIYFGLKAGKMTNYHFRTRRPLPDPVPTQPPTQNEWRDLEDGGWVRADFARELERELAASQAEVERLQTLPESRHQAFLDLLARAEKAEAEVKEIRNALGDDGRRTHKELIQLATRAAEWRNWKEKYTALRNAHIAEGQDPAGTIWEHADKIQQELKASKAEVERLKAQLTFGLTPDKTNQ